MWKRDSWFAKEEILKHVETRFAYDFFILQRPLKMIKQVVASLDGRHGPLLSRPKQALGIFGYYLCIVARNRFPKIRYISHHARLERHHDCGID